MKEHVLQGSGASQLVQVIKKLGHNDSFLLILATVESGLPEVSIKLDGNNAVLPKEFILVLDGCKDKLIPGTRVLVAVMDSETSYVIIDKVVTE